MNSEQTKPSAEEFIREKIRKHKDIQGEMLALGQYLVNGENCLRWAKEFSDLSQLQADAELPSDEWIKNKVKEYNTDLFQEEVSEMVDATDGFLEGLIEMRTQAILCLSKLKQENEALREEVIEFAEWECFNGWSYYPPIEKWINDGVEKTTPELLQIFRSQKKLS